MKLDVLAIGVHPDDVELGCSGTLINEIKRLPPAYRTVFNMYVIDGYKHQEIADILKIAVGTSKSNLSKAKTLLKSYINKNNLQKQACNT